MKNAVDNFLSPNPTFSYNFAYIKKIGNGLDPAGYNQAQTALLQYIMANKSNKRNLGRPVANIAHLFNGDQNEFTGIKTGKVNAKITKPTIITLKIEGVENPFTIFKKIPSIKSAYKNIIDRTNRYSKLYKIEKDLVFQDGDILFESMFESPLYRKERHEAESVAQTALLKKKKTMADLWALASVLGYTKTNAAKLQDDGNIEIDVASSGGLIDQIAETVLPAKRYNQDYTQLLAPMEQLADTEANAVMINSEIFEPLLKLAPADMRDSIRQNIRGIEIKEYATKDKAGGRQEPGRVQELANITRSIAGSDVSISVNRAMRTIMAKVLNIPNLKIYQTTNFYLHATRDCVCWGRLLSKNIQESWIHCRDILILNIRLQKYLKIHLGVGMLYCLIQS